MKKLIKKLVRDKLKEDFEKEFTNKWEGITSELNPFDITNKYDSNELIDLITHFDTEYFTNNLDELLSGVQTNKTLKKWKKVYIEFLLKDKVGVLSPEEREKLSSFISKNSNDKPDIRI